MSRPNSSALTKRYGSRENFLQLFGVDQQVRHTRDAQRCIVGTAPTLAAVNESYGAGTAEAWLTFQVAELSEYCGARDKIQPAQLRQLASLLASEYYWLKVTEFELFFRRFKLGRYGSFYGTVDPLLITEHLRTFLRERADTIDRYESQRRLQQQELPAGACTLERYHELVRAAFVQWMKWSRHPPRYHYLVPFNYHNTKFPYPLFLITTS